MIRIERWFTRSDAHGHAYRDPASCGIHLKGYVYGHPKYEDGAHVSTGTITDVAGMTVTTSSGRVYTLGEPNAEWLAWMAKEGIAFDPAAPIRDLRSPTPTVPTPGLETR